MVSCSKTYYKVDYMISCNNSCGSFHGSFVKNNLHKLQQIFRNKEEHTQCCCALCFSIGNSLIWAQSAGGAGLCLNTLVLPLKPVAQPWVVFFSSVPLLTC